MTQDLPSDTIEFTAEQIANWRKYARVRAAGWYNMFDPRALNATRLTEDEYVFVMRNYEKLRETAQREPSQ
jgi:hypothetical protein